MKSKLKKDLNNTYLILEHESIYNEDYQLNMIKVNKLKGLLEVIGRGMDRQSQFHYEISGKVSIKAVFEKARIKNSDMKALISQLLELLKELRSHMLDVNRLILDPEYIFYMDEQFYFCFDPLHEEPVCEAFHTITEYFVSQIDYDEKEAVFFAYELHKATMEENYSVEQVVHRITKQCQNNQMLNLEVKSNNEIYSDDDWEEDEKNEGIVDVNIKKGFKKKEGFGMLQLLKKLVNKRKASKWGDWNDLLLEEE